MGLLDFVDPGNAGGSTAVPVRRRERDAEYRCGKCSRVFKSGELRADHEFSDHSVPSAALYLHNRWLAPGEDVQLHWPVDTSELRFGAVSGLRMSVNDSAPVDASASRLVEELSGTIPRIIHVWLPGPERPVRFRYEPFLEDDLTAIDTHFLAIMCTGQAGRAELSDFVARTAGCTGTAYRDALVEYSIAILAKEGHRDCVLPFQDYPKRLHAAAGTLDKVDRSVAKTICAIVGFSLNDFINAPVSTGAPSLERAIEWFRVRLGLPTLVRRSKARPATTHRLLLDDVVMWLIDAVSDWNPNQVVLSRGMSLLTGLLSPYDEAKLRLVLAEGWRESGQHAIAQGLAVPLVHDRVFEKWARGFLNND